MRDSRRSLFLVGDRMPRTLVRVFKRQSCGHVPRGPDGGKASQTNDHATSIRVISAKVFHPRFSLPALLTSPFLAEQVCIRARGPFIISQLQAAVVPGLIFNPLLILTKVPLDMYIESQPSLPVVQIKFARGPPFARSPWRPRARMKKICRRLTLRHSNKNAMAFNLLPRR